MSRRQHSDNAPAGAKLCVIALVLLATCVCGGHVCAQQQPQVAQPLATEAGARPALRLKGVDGKTYDVAEMRGQIVLASFGATWCQPCHAEVAALEELRAEYTNKPVRFLWISIESADEISNSLLRHRAKQMRITMPVLRDPDQQAFAQFTIRRRMPLVVVYDAEGALASAPMFGMSDAETYKKHVREKLDSALRATSTTGADGGTSPVKP